VQEASIAANGSVELLSLLLDINIMSEGPVAKPLMKLLFPCCCCIISAGCCWKQAEEETAAECCSS
jgi:hypothetical protein